MTIIGKAVEWATKGRQQACESCGETFTCGPLTKGGCWCRNEKVPLEKLDELKTRYKRCLCPGCLRKAAAGAPVPQA